MGVNRVNRIAILLSNELERYFLTDYINEYRIKQKSQNLLN